jgi:hypothetical protein
MVDVGEEGRRVAGASNGARIHLDVTIVSVHKGFLAFHDVLTQGDDERGVSVRGGGAWVAGGTSHVAQITKRLR